MLTVGDRLPAFDLTATVDISDPSTAFQNVRSDSYAGKWLVVFAWPKDFTFVCPTEIAAFGKLNGEFADRDAQVLGLSTDSEFVKHRCDIGGTMCRWKESNSGDAITLTNSATHIEAW